MAKNCHAFTAMESSAKTKINKKNEETNHKQELTNMSPIRNY